MKHLLKTNYAIVVSMLAIASAPVYAHVSAEPKQVVAGEYARIAIKIPHGCDDAPTNSVIVHLPEAFQNAKPMPKAGWDLKIREANLSEPYENNGKIITIFTSQIEWSGGSLPTDFYDEFVFYTKVSGSPKKLYIPVEQKCGNKNIMWQATSHDDAYPAATLDVLPSAAEHGAHHH
ncbi:YcnI family protein [Hydromonas duriensis]|uniref:Uncharacterized protein YcnI n=1 Tax=Hydromonas duriensis TaxID=1527608 RepID=A0A4V3DJT0_9BURK|nr:YcnI family protein [Hydromonas duriensis]TDR31276.1 uncharacterized protein YcnI [Hydromonas duriensis]